MPKPTLQTSLNLFSTVTLLCAKTFLLINPRQQAVFLMSPLYTDDCAFGIQIKIIKLFPKQPRLIQVVVEAMVTAAQRDVAFLSILKRERQKPFGTLLDMDLAHGNLPLPTIPQPWHGRLVRACQATVTHRAGVSSLGHMASGRQCSCQGGCQERCHS